MESIESLRMAWRSIRAHRLRSTLTALGVIVGVAAVITFVTLGASLQGAIIGEVAAEQSPTMTIRTQLEGPGGGPGGGSGQAVFTETDLERLVAIDGVSAVVPRGSVALSGVSYRNQSLALGGLIATTPSFFDLSGQGNFSDGEPFETGTRQVVLNERAATIFEENVTVGETMSIRPAGSEPVEVTVVGIVRSGGGLFDPGIGSQPVIYAPADPFYETRLDSPTTGAAERVYPLVTIVATDYARIDTVADEARAYFDGSSDAEGLLAEPYEIVVQTNEELVEQIQNILNTFTGFITGIAVISLVVGAIGIANIMLVSVTERTREIGIMKAVGFQNRDILQLFLVESAILGVLGSVVGVIVGLITAFAATEYIDLPLSFPPEWAGIAVVVGFTVGIVSGLYPAWRGARTDPIDALRYE